MATKTKKEKSNKIIVISLGGSVVYPYKEGNSNGLDIPFLTEFRQFMLEQAKTGKRFIIVVGGGKPCRMYQKAAREVLGAKK